jgi:hypothetical protein
MKNKGILTAPKPGNYSTIESKDNEMWDKEFMHSEAYY